MKLHRHRMIVLLVAMIFFDISSGRKREKGGRNRVDSAENNVILYGSRDLAEKYF